MKRMMIKRISLVTLLCFLSLLYADAYPLAAGQEENGLALIAQGETDYGNGLFQEALASFNQALGMVQERGNRERLMLDIALAHYALKDNGACAEALRSLVKLNAGRQIDLSKLPEGFVQLYGQANWQVQEAQAEQKKAEALTMAEAQRLAEESPGLIEKSAPQAQVKKKKKFPWLLAILGVGIVAGVIILLSKRRKEPAAYYTLTVTKNTGASGTPETGSFIYEKGEVIAYNYTTMAGYISVEVKLDGAAVAASGSITMDQDHTLSVTAKNEFYDYDTATLKITWVQIPAGEFRMGDSYKVGDSRELPVHTVMLGAYSISKHEVTFAQYDKFCTETKRKKAYDQHWGRNTMPVINVSWEDADAFCKWLANKTGKNIHLATEAQWERAAAGTDQRKYPWGSSSPSCSRVNYNNCVRKPKKVGSYPSGASAAGVMEMSGNVWEWCQDWFSESYYQECANEGTVSNPQGPATGSERILRGGGFREAAIRMRCAFRDYVYPEYLSRVIGFRIVWEN